MDVLAEKVIPAARENGVKVIYVNWGLVSFHPPFPLDPPIDLTPWFHLYKTEEEVIAMPPCHAASFGAVVRPGREFEAGFGSPMGTIAGHEAGGLLMRGAWNSELYEPLQSMYEAGAKAGTDAWIHKNRMSAMWNADTLLATYLAEQGIKVSSNLIVLSVSKVANHLHSFVKTLFYSGVNSDQVRISSS